jgi:hypothetical protein
MTIDAIPDIKALIKGFGAAAHREWPDVVSELDVARVNTANDQFLVLLRVLFGIAKRCGMSQSVIDKIVEDAKRRPDNGRDDDLFAASTSSVGKLTAQPSAWDVLGDVDKVLTDIKLVSKVPSWFIEDFWPGAIRRVASGKRLSDHELDIMRTVVATVKGEL